MNKHVKTTLITLSVTVIFYFLVSSLINYGGMKIYSPDQVYVLDNGGMFTITPTIQNNAALTLPFNSPLFYYRVNKSIENVSCTFSSRNCGENVIIDIGKIESGESKSLDIKVIPNNNSHFRIDVSGYLNTFNRGILRKSVTINCLISNESENKDKKYLCKELRRV